MVKDLSGQTFGYWTVIKKAEKPNNRKNEYHSYWLCRCKCGKEQVIIGTNLTRGLSKSCGCYMKDHPNGKTHGLTNTRPYRIWQCMKNRCYNSNREAYKDYGGRANNSIEVCDKWRNDFQAFYDDVSKLPHFDEDGYSLERIDNNKGYQLDNVKWATRTEQANNKRNNRLLEFNGKKLTIAQWSRETGLKASTIGMRINYGWPIERALTEKPIKGKNQYTNKTP